MFVLESHITIGPYKNVKVNECKVTRSMMSYVDKAVIRLPISARVQKADRTVTRTAETAKLIETGMAVQIDLGYNSKLKNEFIGFVSRVNFTTPCEIECEGYSYLLRKQNYNQSFKNTTLKAILQFLVKGAATVNDTAITLSPLIPDLKINKWVIDNKTGTEVLEELKKELRLTIFFTNNVLYAGLLLFNPRGDVKYRLGWNTIKDDQLKLRQVKDDEYIVRIKGEKKDGTKVTASVGNKGVVKQIQSHNVTDESTLKAIATAEQKKLSYDGYEGKISAFLQPWCTPGFKAELIDAQYPTRSGNYIVESTEVLYGSGGGRRSVGIGYKL